LNRWVQEAQVPFFVGQRIAAEEELCQVRQEVERLRMERDILKNPRPSSPSHRDEVSVYRDRKGAVPDTSLLSGITCGAKRMVLLAAAADESPPRGKAAVVSTNL